MGDAGLTGRKIIVDTIYGAAPWRWRILRQGTHRRSTARPPTPVVTSPRISSPPVSRTNAEIQVSYAIGVAEPTSIMVIIFGTGNITDERITELVRAHFDLRPLRHPAHAGPAQHRGDQVSQDRRLRPLRSSENAGFSWEDDKGEEDAQGGRSLNYRRTWKLRRARCRLFSEEPAVGAPPRLTKDGLSR